MARAGPQASYVSRALLLVIVAVAGLIIVDDPLPIQLLVGEAWQAQFAARPVVHARRRA